MVASCKRFFVLGLVISYTVLPGIAIHGCSATNFGVSRTFNEAGASVTFYYPDDGETSRVCVVGDFNAWELGADCMAKVGEGWESRVMLAPGRYSYAFVVDGSRWVPDPGALLKEDNGFGGENSVLIVE